MLQNYFFNVFILKTHFTKFLTTSNAFSNRTSSPISKQLFLFWRPVTYRQFNLYPFFSEIACRTSEILDLMTIVNSERRMEENVYVLCLKILDNIPFFNHVFFQLFILYNEYMEILKINAQHANEKYTKHVFNYSERFFFPKQKNILNNYYNRSSYNLNL